MKKIISMILVCTMLLTTVNISFAAEVEQGDITSYGASAAKDITKINEVTINDDQTGISVVKEPDVPDIITNKEQLARGENNAAKVASEVEKTRSAASAITSTDFIFNANLLTSFNTITAPKIGNGANEPKFSYNSFLEESVSDYSGELTLNFEDLVLDGRNGLDLRIGRTYQTVSSSVSGNASLMVLPNSNGYLVNKLVNDYSTYQIDRYNLGVGWSFSFPSVQVETEYIPQEVVDTYYYDEETELYYHSGNGEVYQVQFTSDTTDSNLKGYYNKDIQFNRNDKSYSNGQVTSYYSLTDADKTKQYFAEDGRLIGIVDRFGNTIKFEHELHSITNRVPQGNFAYREIEIDGDEFDEDMWFTSTASNGTYDAIQLEETDIGSNDGYVMYFRRNNEYGDTYILSQPIQIKPLTYYDFGMRFKSQYGDDIKVEIIGYDTAYNIEDEETIWIRDYDTQNWVDFTDQFAMSSAIRYIQIKITPEYAKYMYIDTVSLDEPKPLISKITDSVGRTVTFNYTGGIDSLNEAGAVTLTVSSPDGSTSRVLTYNKTKIEYTMAYQDHADQRLYWYLANSDTEGEDGVKVYYTYDGGSTFDSAGNQTWLPLYMRYDTKTQSSNDKPHNKPVLNSIHYKDRMKIYEYETVRKHLGDDGYYDTLRVKKKYDKYMHAPAGSTTGEFTGEVGVVNYTYGGTYDGNSFNNETGYPNYTFDDETTLNELWTVTKTGKATESITFSNCAVVKQSSSSGGVTATSDYTNHSTFKNSPTQIKNTISEGGDSKETYLLYSYNDWGGVASETKEIDASIKNNSALLEKYTTSYSYNDTYHLVTEKCFYNNVDEPQVSETYTYGTNGLLTESKNAVGEKIQYYYENATYPGLLTKTTQDDPMRFHNLMGGDAVTTYSYDNYGLYPTIITQQYEDGNSQTAYVYDYITGDVLREVLPDASYTDYTYYSDGKVKQVVSPLTQYLDGRTFYTIELHTYQINALFEGYSDELPAYSAEKIYKYIVYTDENVAVPYGYEANLYDAVGNLKVNQQGYFKDGDSSMIYIRPATKYYHDNYDRLIKTVDSIGNVVLYTYDGFDRPVSVTDSENNVYQYSYNSIANTSTLKLNGATESTDRLLLTQVFDNYGNVISQTAYPNNSTSETLTEAYEYDLNNNVISYSNPKGNNTTYLYDAANRLRETVLPNGVKATSTYSTFNTPTFEKIYDEEGDERSARISYRNEKGDMRMRFFNYDRRMVDSDGYAADSKGRTTQINEGENAYSFIYDELDHPVILTSGESQIHRRYDQFGEIAAASTDGNTPTIRYGHNYFGDISVKLQNEAHYISYGYNSIGKAVQGLMPSERLENYTYTANGNLDTIVSDNKTFDYDYYDTGYVKSITYPNGLKTTYNYDNINRVTSMTTTKGTTTINTLLYEYDSNGNVVSETRNGAETTYTYDSLDRLLSVTYSDGSSVTYEYDALNNRTKETYSNGDVKDYVYDKKYQLQEVKLNGQVTDTFTYNESGAVVTHNDKTYTYDEWDRMSSYSDGTDTYTYKYDANGIRTQKNDKQYVVDINNNVIAETDNTGTITDEILWGHQPLARKVNGSWYYYIYNAHGDVVGLVNEAGTVVNTYEYTPWGEIRSETETVDNPIKYAGEYYDDELDMIYLRARYYDPQIGRFTSLDIEEGEIANPLDMNRYVYCRNNPIKYVDPTGEAVVIAGIAITGELLALIGTGIVILGYLASKAFVNAFTSAINTGKSIRDSIIYAKGKSKDPTPPSKLKDGDKVKTPDTHPDEFNKKKDGSYEHKKTGWKFKRDYSRHGGDHWDASPDGKSGNYINVNPNGTIR